MKTIILGPPGTGKNNNIIKLSGRIPEGWDQT